MAEKQLVTRKIGSEAVLELIAINNNQLKLEVIYDGEQADAGMYLLVDAMDVLTALVKSTETKWDDRILELAKEFLD